MWTTWTYDDERSILSCPKRWFQFNSRIVKAHFLGIMTLNNWKMIAETRRDIFRWRSRFRRRPVCLSFLLILPYERPTGPGLTWQTIWPTFLFSRAIAVRQLTFVVVSDNIFWNSCIYFPTPFWSRSRVLCPVHPVTAPLKIPAQFDKLLLFPSSRGNTALQRHYSTAMSPLLPRYVPGVEGPWFTLTGALFQGN